MRAHEGENRQQMLSDAAQYLQRAIELLDRAEAPAQIAAHVDLAVHQLHAELGEESASGSAGEKGSEILDFGRGSASLPRRRK